MTGPLPLTLDSLHLCIYLCIYVEFTKAFDSVIHSMLLFIFQILNIPDS